MPGARVLLRTTLIAGSALRNQVVDGLGAVAGEHRSLIAPAERPKVGDSLDLDDASRDEFPQANRWDYLLSVPAHSQIIGLEPHSAKDSEISVVIAKKQHAIAYLHAHLPPGRRVAKWFWVSSGRVGFSKMERARRRLDQSGIAFVDRLLKSLA